jgi:hypothetical protein
MYKGGKIVCGSGDFIGEEISAGDNYTSWWSMFGRFGVFASYAVLFRRHSIVS